ncbi:uncharacterized protein Triagg1_9767 [Trichoderma aggressivum f. europaeum]|uniref:Uncharacterized protein n=1 Tax=Trichoderma aggressivum f. europaeum TaxID=173218 RepID=A0AAE1IA18_9HYPO|nr:hypothetical protein Triagg1_9767 [Trichoderma aggressivum f. europaeum]
MQTHAFEVKAVELAQKFQQVGCLSDIDEAIKIMEYAISKADDVMMPHMLDHLGAMLGMRFDQTRSMCDLNRAISIATIAVNLTAHDDLSRPQHLLNLGHSLGRREVG